MSAQLDTAWSQPRCCPSQIFLSPPASMEPNGRQAQRPVPIGVGGGRPCSRLQRLSRLHGIATTDLSPDVPPAACGDDGGGRRHELSMRGRPNGARLVARAQKNCGTLVGSLCRRLTVACSPRRPRCRFRPPFYAHPARRCTPVRPDPSGWLAWPPGMRPVRRSSRESRSSGPRFTAQHSWLAAHGSRLAAHGSRITDHGSQLTVSLPGLTVHASRPTVHG